MKISELVSKLSLEVLSMPDPDAEVIGGYSGDLLSWVMGRAEQGCVWVTIMTNINIIAVASLVGVSAVIVAENAEIDDSIIQKANEQNINLIRSAKASFETIADMSKII